jgi:hypothetical protein
MLLQSVVRWLAFAFLAFDLASAPFHPHGHGVHVDGIPSHGIHAEHDDGALNDIDTDAHEHSFSHSIVALWRPDASDVGVTHAQSTLADDHERNASHAAQKRSPTWVETVVIVGRSYLRPASRAPPSIHV